MSSPDLQASTLVEDGARAADLIARLQAAPALALDVEGDGMFRYRARLCTVQLASEREIAVVDTLALDVVRFAPLFSAAGPEKIVHDASFDARLLAAAGAPLGNVFDTAIAARFLGFAATGLASLLESLFAVTLPKHLQMADWGQRPLGDEEVAYLENDVRHLIPLRDALLEQVRARDIEAELREECAYVLAEALRVEPERSPFARIKNAQARSARERARLYELAEVRDALARELDQPAARLLNNELLFRLAQLSSPGVEELERRLPTRVREHAPRFLRALATAREDAPAAEVEPTEAPSPSELTRRKRRRALLIDFRTREAARREVDAQVVLPGHCVSELVKLSRLDRESLARVPGFGAVRVERYAELWERELAPQWSA